MEGLEDEENQGNLHDTLLVFTTDNLAVESCVYKGKSTSEKLYYLIVRLRGIEISTGERLIIIFQEDRWYPKEQTQGVQRLLERRLVFGKSDAHFLPMAQDPLWSVFGPIWLY